jgi:large subunit ribosomal protein L6
MSRIGKQPIDLPKGVTVSAASREVHVKGPKGELKLLTRPEVEVSIDGNAVSVVNKRPSGDRQARAFHGMTRALIQNMVTGVSQGYEKKLEINGVGYQVKQQGKDLVFTLGYANEIVVPIPASIEVKLPSATAIAISGCDKQQVGEFAARIRKLKPPEPYKGKGIKFDTEVVRRKPGKAFGSA